MLGKERKERDEGGGVGPEVSAGLHAEEVSERVVVHAMLRVASEHGVPGNDVPGGHIGEDVGGVVETGALHVHIDERGGDEEVGVEAGGGGVVVDGAAGVDVGERGAGLEDEGEGVLVGGDAAAEHGAVELGRVGGEERAAPGVGADEGVVGANVRVGDLVEQVAGEGEVAAGDVLLELELELELARGVVGGRWTGAGGGGEETAARRRRWGEVGVELRGGGMVKERQGDRFGGGVGRRSSRNWGWDCDPSPPHCSSLCLAFPSTRVRRLHCTNDLLLLLQLPLRGVLRLTHTGTEEPKKKRKCLSI